MSYSKIAEPLLARLYRQIAGESRDEMSAGKLEQLALECERAAADSGADDDQDGQIH